MKTSICILYSVLNTFLVFCQIEKISIKSEFPLRKGFLENYVSQNDIHISQNRHIAIFSPCDSVFSTENGKIISIESTADSSQMVIIKAGKFRLYYYGLYKLNFVKGDMVFRNQYIGLAKKKSDLGYYTISFQIGDNRIYVWNRQKQESYLITRK